MNSEQTLGLDIGKTRTGIARASGVARLAEPLMTVKTEELIQVLKDLIKENGYNAIAIGLPRNLQGNETIQTQWVRYWVEKKAKQHLKVPLYWQDEAMTTKMAQVHKLAAGKKMPHDVDAIAAAIILQDFIDTPEAQRVSC